MRERGAAFGGEVSGHYYFRDFWCADSGTLPALLVLELLSAEGRSLSELVGELRRHYFISGEINSEVADPGAKMNDLAARYSDAEVSWLDGVSVDYPDWHFNVRPSNTEPLLRLNLESLVSPRGHGGASATRCSGSLGRERTAEEALEQAARGRDPPLRIPTPFAVGRVNCYLIEDEPLTLVDAGPNSGKALDELERQLGARALDRGHRAGR